MFCASKNICVVEIDLLTNYDFDKQHWIEIAYLCSRGSAVGIAHFIKGYIDKIVMG